MIHNTNVDYSLRCLAVHKRFSVVSLSLNSMRFFGSIVVAYTKIGPGHLLKVEAGDPREFQKIPKTSQASSLISR